MDSVSASLSIRLVLFCLSACICNPQPLKPLPLTIFFLAPSFIIQRDGGIQAEEAVTPSHLAKKRTNKEKGWHFFSLEWLNSCLPRHPSTLPAPSIHQSRVHACDQGNNGIQCNCNQSVSRLICGGAMPSMNVTSPREEGDRGAARHTYSHIFWVTLSLTQHACRFPFSSFPGKNSDNTWEV